ncbi:hypothetical protein EMIHUDRAFT_237800 [Emiliania huxleyi CCMP1516]|uniref:Uncharacterized protein n=2 Tax=Emiliania huxleyi TaxID=2903 RepID=A0A0D3JPD5_EMIH1|nr:hypothetical protein EMIHUDRAFT_237800 [Emiliania huxleyi CCMP1516]EOD25370.1 hypothetical protein EMIHUDRAFT_237800 [Emiliania huxleyi CCMP1516]|eukprot:XP_005777799.1 hypothetical protein EMIHUDRAFT_237800 [Emiliania huxleyi CCMP1516]
MLLLLSPGCGRAAPRTRAARLLVGQAEPLSEAEARALWLARQGTPSSQRPVAAATADGPASEACHRERSAARRRMLDAMGGPEVYRYGADRTGYAGFGGYNDDYYGYGPPPARDLEPQKLDLLTGRPVTDEGAYEGQGFDGRSDGWRRRAEAVSPIAPSPADTLRSPSAGARPAQAFSYDLSYDEADYAVHADHDEAVVGGRHLDGADEALPAELLALREELFALRDPPPPQELLERQEDALLDALRHTLEE